MIDAGYVLVALAAGILFGMGVTYFMLGAHETPLQEPEIPDTAYDFCPRPGCTMAAQHRADLARKK